MHLFALIAGLLCLAIWIYLLTAHGNFWRVAGLRSNVQPVAAIAEIVELNIGHAIVARALFDGLPAAVREMRALMVSARGR